MTPPPWHITDSACDRYAYAMRWRRPDRVRARQELADLVETAGYKDSDGQGRELWRCSKRLGRGLRCVVDTSGRLLWVGQGVPPESVWMTPG